MFSRILVGCLLFLTAVNAGHPPIVLWHGMGDSCCFSFSLGKIAKYLNETLGGVYVHSLKIGDSITQDVEHGYFLHPDKQIEMACKMVKEDPQLKDGFNAIGFSQGSQFLRALVQRCDGIKMKNLISVGGQHQGVYGLPNCASLSHESCNYIRKLLNNIAYNEWVQKTLVQATYWHDPLNENAYKNGSTFLADINNENYVNEDYKNRLQSLENFVMIKFSEDTMVQPKESEWFGFYTPNQDKEVDTLQKTSLYLEDRLGLKNMDENNKLHFLTSNGQHLQFDWNWFEENIVKKFLQ